MALYVEGTNEVLVQIMKTDAGRQVIGLTSWDQIVNKCGTTGDINEEHKRGLDNMKMHGQLFIQQYSLALVDIERCHKLLRSAYL